MSATIVRKISTKTVIGGVAAMRAADEGAIMRVYGVMSGIQTGTTVRQDNQGNPIEDPWTAFIGQFQAVNLETGEMFASAKAFLPGAAGEMIEAAWKAGQDKEEPISNMKFAFDIVKKNNEASVTGYEYQARPLLETTASDPLLEMAEGLPQLPAPKPAPDVDGNAEKPKDQKK